MPCEKRPAFHPQRSLNAEQTKRRRRHILDPRILPYLQPGYSVLYQLCNLIETLEKKYAND